MLVLSRRENEAVRIGDNIVVRVVSVKGQRVRLAFDAPDDVKILRTEVATWDDDGDRAGAEELEREYVKLG